MVIVSEAEFSAILRESIQKISEVVDFFSSGSGRILFTGYRRRSESNYVRAGN